MIHSLIKFFPIAERVMDKKTSLDVLKHICVHNGYMRMTDLEHSVKIPIMEKRSFTIPIKVLKQVLTSKPKELEIELLNENKAKVIYDSKSVTFPYISPDDYPREVQEEFTYVGTWTRAVFIQFHNQLPFVSTDMLKMALNGICVEQNSKLSSCATNGHILRYIKNLDPDGKCELKKDIKIILPVKTIQILAKHTHGNLKVALSPENIRFTMPDGIEFTSRLIDSTYPQYQKVITDPSNRVDFTVESMIKVIKEAKPFSNPVTTRASFNIANGDINISTNNSDDDTRFEAALKTREHNGNGLTTVFDLTLLDTLLKSIKTGNVTWHYDDNNSASIFTNGDQVINLIMPVKL